MSDDRPRDPGASDQPGDGPSHSLQKGSDTGGDSAREVTYGYGAPSYGSGSGSTGGNSYDANQAQGPTTDLPADPNSGYAPPGGSSSYDAAAYPPPGGHDAGSGYGTGAPSPYGPPAGGPYGAPPAPKKKNTGLIVTLVAVGLVVLLGAIGGIVLLASGGGDDTKPAATVQAYLQALADGNAAEALAQGEKPSDTTFATDEALKAQQELAPISSISVSEGYSTSRSARVNATYQFGEKQADESFSLTKIGGTWKLDDTTYPIDLSSLDDLPGLTLFGIDASGKDSVNVFPGPLAWGSSNDYFEVAERDADDFSLSPSDGSYSYSTLETTLSDAGEKAVAEAVSTYITTCAAAKDLTPDGCPQREYDYSAVDGTATWTAPTDFSSLEYQTSSPVTEVYVSGDLLWSVTYTSEDFNGAQTPVSKSDVDGSIYGTVDLTQDPPVFSD